MSRNNKGPPVLKEDRSYSQWKHELSAWVLLTDLEKKKQGIAVYLNGLEGKYKELISKLPIADLNKDEGVTLITNALYIYCESNEAQRAYTTYEKLHTFRRSSETPISESLLSFDSLVCDMKAMKIELPTTVLAYHVLIAMNIGEDNEKLARATVSALEYPNMVTKIKAIMDTKTGAHNLVEAGEVKIEEDADTAVAYYTRGNNWTRRGRGGGRRSRAGRNVWDQSVNGRFPSHRKCYTCGAFCRDITSPAE